MGTGNIVVANYVKDKILERLVNFAEFQKENPSILCAKLDVEERGRRLLKEYKKNIDEEYSRLFYQLNLECLVRWAKEFGKDPANPSQASEFLKAVAKVYKAGVKLPDVAYLTLYNDPFKHMANQQKSRRSVGEGAQNNSLFGSVVNQSFGQGASLKEITPPQPTIQPMQQIQPIVVQPPQTQEDVTELKGKLKIVLSRLYQLEDDLMNNLNSNPDITIDQIGELIAKSASHFTKFGPMFQIVINSNDSRFSKERSLALNEQNFIKSVSQEFQKLRSGSITNLDFVSKVDTIHKKYTIRRSSRDINHIEPSQYSHEDGWKSPTDGSHKSITNDRNPPSRTTSTREVQNRTSNTPQQPLPPITNTMDVNIKEMSIHEEPNPIIHRRTAEFGVGPSQGDSKVAHASQKLQSEEMEPAVNLVIPRKRSSDKKLSNVSISSSRNKQTHDFFNETTPLPPQAATGMMSDKNFFNQSSTSQTQSNQGDPSGFNNFFEGFNFKKQNDSQVRDSNSSQNKETFGPNLGNSKLQKSGVSEGNNNWANFQFNQETAPQQQDPFFFTKPPGDSLRNSKHMWGSDNFFSNPEIQQALPLASMDGSRQNSEHKQASIHNSAVQQSVDSSGARQPAAEPRLSNSQQTPHHLKPIISQEAIAHQQPHFSSNASPRDGGTQSVFTWGEGSAKQVSVPSRLAAPEREGNGPPHVAGMPDVGNSPVPVSHPANQNLNAPLHHKSEGQAVSQQASPVQEMATQRPFDGRRHSAQLQESQDPWKGFDMNQPNNPEPGMTFDFDFQKQNESKDKKSIEPDLEYFSPREGAQFIFGTTIPAQTSNSNTEWHSVNVDAQGVIDFLHYSKDNSQNILPKYPGLSLYPNASQPHSILPQNFENNPNISGSPRTIQQSDIKLSARTEQNPNSGSQLERREIPSEPHNFSESKNDRNNNYGQSMQHSHSDVARKLDQNWQTSQGNPSMGSSLVNHSQQPIPNQLQFPPRESNTSSKEGQNVVNFRHEMGDQITHHDPAVNANPTIFGGSQRATSERNVPTLELPAMPSTMINQSTASIQSSSNRYHGSPSNFSQQRLQIIPVQSSATSYPHSTNESVVRPQSPMTLPIAQSAHEPQHRPDQTAQSVLSNEPHFEPPHPTQQQQPYQPPHLRPQPVQSPTTQPPALLPIPNQVQLAADRELQTKLSEQQEEILSLNRVVRSLQQESAELRNSCLHYEATIQRLRAELNDEHVKTAELDAAVARASRSNQMLEKVLEEERKAAVAEREKERGRLMSLNTELEEKTKLLSKMGVDNRLLKVDADKVPELEHRLQQMKAELLKANTELAKMDALNQDRNKLKSDQRTIVESFDEQLQRAKQNFDKEVKQLTQNHEEDRAMYLQSFKKEIEKLNSHIRDLESQLHLKEAALALQKTMNHPVNQTSNLLLPNPTSVNISNLASPAPNMPSNRFSFDESSAKIQQELLESELKQAREETIKLKVEKGFIKEKLQEKIEELAAADEKLNQLGRELAESQEQNYVKVKDCYQKEHELSEVNNRLTELMRKHTTLLKNLEVHQQNEKDLRKELNEYHSRLMRMGGERNSDRLGDNANSPHHVNEIARLKEVNTMNEEKINHLLKVNSQMKQRLMEREIDLNLSTNSSSEDKIRLKKIVQENEKLKDEAFTTKRKVVDLEEQVLDSYANTSTIAKLKQELVLYRAVLNEAKSNNSLKFTSHLSEEIDKLLSRPINPDSMPLPASPSPFSSPMHPNFSQRFRTDEERATKAREEQQNVISLSKKNYDDFNKLQTQVERKNSDGKNEKDQTMYHVSSQPNMLPQDNKPKEYGHVNPQLGFKSMNIPQEGADVKPAYDSIVHSPSQVSDIHTIDAKLPAREPNRVESTEVLHTMPELYNNRPVNDHKVHTPITNDRDDARGHRAPFGADLQSANEGHNLVEVAQRRGPASVNLEQTADKKWQKEDHGSTTHRGKATENSDDGPGSPIDQGLSAISDPSVTKDRTSPLEGQQNNSDSNQLRTETPGFGTPLMQPVQVQRQPEFENNALRTFTFEVSSGAQASKPVEISFMDPVQLHQSHASLQMEDSQSRSIVNSGDKRLVDNSGQDGSIKHYGTQPIRDYLNLLETRVFTSEERGPFKECCLNGGGLFFENEFLNLFIESITPGNYPGKLKVDMRIVTSAPVYVEDSNLTDCGKYSLP
jgi:hypothetical protein